MEKFIRTDCFISIDEYEIIDSYYRGYNDTLCVEKNLIIPLEEGEKMNLVVSFENEGYEKDILVTIKPIKANKIDEHVTFIANDLNEVMGVKKLNCRFPKKEKLKGTYNFFININRGYNEDVFKNETEYHISNINALKNNGELNPDLIYNEIAYQDFSTEFSMTLASYCLFTNSKFLLEDSYIYNLYEEKLSFNGIYIEEFINTSINCTYNQYFNLIDDCATKTEIFKLMLTYIATIKYATHYSKSNIDNRFLSSIGTKLYKSYLKKEIIKV